jgi:protein gp37
MGCTGCELYDPNPAKNHCYAATLCNRYAGCKGWPKRFDEPEYFPGRLEKAIGWSDLTGTVRPDKPWLDGMPRIVFVNDMSDGFCHGTDPDVWLLPHLDAMGQSPHIWLLLTKWARYMHGFAEDHPLPPNVWPGVSILRQKDDHRITTLCKIRAAVRWISLEPLLEIVNVFGFGSPMWGKLPPSAFLHWIVAGGESGPNARPTHPDWARKPRDDCQIADTPFFWKQWGKWWPHDQGQWVSEAEQHVGLDWDDNEFYPVGKKVAGRLLDGREWNQMPSHNVTRATIGTARR